jgi:hypothetical protein
MPATMVGDNPTPEQVEERLVAWKASLLPSFEVGGLYARSPTAHKWKATFRSLLLREVVFWRLHDLLTQSLELHKVGHALGARILLRSAFETLATLVYLNLQMRKVVSCELDFHQFSDKTTVLLMGSKNNSTVHVAVNIQTVLKHCAKRYEWIERLYGELSESAHPNHEGLLMGYSRPDTEKLVEHFGNHWAKLYSSSHPQGMLLCMDMFQHEYNDELTKEFAALEKWIEANDEQLEATKSKASDAP